MTVDPYRTLGLEPGASAAEVKRAYRRLAKAFHPDSAGEAALPRFLAIHEAYEAIRTGRPMGAARPSPSPAAPAAEPWRADPARARAARERARTNRAGRTGSAGPGPGASGAGARAGTRAGSRGPSGSSGTSGTRPGRRGGTRKATLGSTSYDEARDPADASWSGASWYGPTSGEYWIINPREYADPRKHGPEYQSRARRMGADPSISGTLDGDEPIDATSSATQAGAADAGAADADAADATPWARHESERAAGATRPRGRAFETRAAAADPARGRSRAERLRRGSVARPATGPAAVRGGGSTSATAPARPASHATANPGEAGWAAPRATFGLPARDWLGGSSDDPIRRLGLALLAWPPLGLAAAAAIGDVTGCTSFSAACGGTDSLLPWLAQAGILGLLLLLPMFARLLAGGTLGVLVALLPATAFLIVVGGAGAPQAGLALAVLLGLAWLAGVGWAMLASRRRGLARDSGAAP